MQVRLHAGEKLFNLSLDPMERRNVLADEQRLARGMRQAYDLFATDSRKYASTDSSVAADEETLKKLRSLGYVR